MKELRHMLKTQKKSKKQKNKVKQNKATINRVMTKLRKLKNR